MYNTYLFDMDGTLIDSAPGYIVAFNRLLVKHGQYPADDDTISQTISSGARTTIRQTWQSELTDEQIESLRYEFIEIYNDRPELCQPPYAEPYAGIVDMLRQLQSKGYKTGIVTNKARKLAQPIVDATGLSAVIDILVCPQDSQSVKPDPGGLHFALGELTASEKSAIYIGDHQKDINTAIAASMHSIAVDYGYKDESDNYQDWQATYLAESPQALIQLINNFGVLEKS